MPLILIHSPLGISREHRLQETTTLGRNHACSITLEDMLASRVHALITRIADQWWLLDCDSTNGTYLNGTRIFEAQRLYDGDSINLCAYRCTFSDTIIRGVDAYTEDMQKPSKRVKPIDRSSCFAQSALFDSSSSDHGS